MPKYSLWPGTSRGKRIERTIVRSGWGLLLGARLVAIAKVIFDRVESPKPGIGNFSVARHGKL